jgi:hypothetical protein
MPPTPAFAHASRRRRIKGRPTQAAVAFWHKCDRSLVDLGERIASPAAPWRLYVNSVLL